MDFFSGEIFLSLEHAFKVLKLDVNYPNSSYTICYITSEIQPNYYMGTSRPEKDFPKKTPGLTSSYPHFYWIHSVTRTHARTHTPEGDHRACMRARAYWTIVIF